MARPTRYSQALTRSRARAKVRIPRGKWSAVQDWARSLVVLQEVARERQLACSPVLQVELPSLRPKRASSYRSHPSLCLSSASSNPRLSLPPGEFSRAIDQWGGDPCWNEQSRSQASGL